MKLKATDPRVREIGDEIARLASAGDKLRAKVMRAEGLGLTSSAAGTRAVLEDIDRQLDAARARLDALARRIKSVDDARRPTHAAGRRPFAIGKSD